MPEINVRPLPGTVPVGGLGLPNSGTVEANSDNSVTVDLRDINAAAECGYVVEPFFPVANGLSAAGTTRATAPALTAQLNLLATVPSGAGVELAALLPGQFQLVFNGGANVCTVYAPGTMTIDGVAGVPLTNAKRCQYFCVAPGVISSAQLGAVSA